MIVMLDTSTDFDLCESELGVKVEQLFTPLTGLNPKRPEGRFAIDNGSTLKLLCGRSKSMNLERISVGL